VKNQTHGDYFPGWGYMRFWEPRPDQRTRRGRSDVAASKGRGESEDQLFRGRFATGTYPLGGA